MVTLEVCANSVRSCIEAEKGGAKRVELCAAIPEGGTTPSYGEIAMARKSINIDLNVIIRPRGGDFLYSKEEIEAMKSDIEICRTLGVNGVVFGCLTKEGEVDVELCRELLESAKGLSTTFHRAFDLCNDPFRALKQITELGFDRILTSGQKATAYQGRELLKELIEKAGDSIIILIGSGVNENNIKELYLQTKAEEFHLSLRLPVKSEMQFRRDGIAMGGNNEADEFSVEYTSSQRVKKCLELLNF